MTVPHDSHQTGWWTISVLVLQKTIIILVVRETKILLAENAVLSYFPANTYLFKIKNRNTREKCKICSKLKIKTPEQRHWRRSGVFTVNFEHISHLF